MKESFFLAPAKINLGLWIQGKRDDGFHELTTIFQEIPLFDFLKLEEASEKILLCPGIENKDNLIMKAWQILENQVGRFLPAKITVTKNIPLQAGLGGGSSDAAHTLKALDSFLNLGIEQKILLKLASQLGSDTAFFIEGGCQLGKGRGEILTKIDSKWQGYVLLGVPDFGLSTPEVFAHFSRFSGKLTPSESPVNILREMLEGPFPDRLVTVLHNDLTKSALALEKKLETFMKNLTLVSNSKVFLSGSGSSCFSLLQKPPEKPKNFPSAYLGLLNLKNRSIEWEFRA
jgi:4-diphosphocytidyl-2-C-methyl-D-erythritol kinase